MGISSTCVKPRRFAYVGELRCEIPVAEEAAGVVRGTHPRAQVHFVDRVRGVERVRAFAAPHPFRVVPLVADVPDHGPGLRRGLAAERVGIGLVDPIAGMLRHDMVFVNAALPGLRHAGVPDARCVTGLAHRDLARVPAVEVAHHRHRRRVRRPDGELRGALDEMRAELLVEPRMGAFPVQIKIVTGQRDARGGDGAHINLSLSAVSSGTA